MLLREHLTEYTKEQLLNQARSFDLRKCSTLRKAALIDRIVEYFCTKEILRSRLSCLTVEQMNLFRKACEMPQDISINQIVDSLQMSRYLFGSFEEDTDRFCVFEEIKEVFKTIDDKDFRDEQHKKGWMMKCLHFFIEYYGISPIEVIYELYKLKVNDTIDDMIDMLWDMPVDIVESCIFSMDNLGLTNLPKDDPIYSPRGILIHLPIFEEEGIDNLLRSQYDKTFFIPSVHQIEEICMNEYESSSPAYKNLEIFFRKNLDMSYEHAVSWCIQVWANSYNGESPAEVISKISESGIAFQNEKQLEVFVELLMDAHNNTRMKENRGHKPIELRRKEFSKGMPTIVPGSSRAAEMLKDAMPQLNGMGFSVDLDENADVATTLIYSNDISSNPIRIEKKIYPNDPCPCGSGKKYKKCCGRNSM